MERGASSCPDEPRQTDLNTTVPLSLAGKPNAAATALFHKHRVMKLSCEMLHRKLNNWAYGMAGLHRETAEAARSSSSLDPKVLLHIPGWEKCGNEPTWVGNVWDKAGGELRDVTCAHTAAIRQRQPPPLAQSRCRFE